MKTQEEDLNEKQAQYETLLLTESSKPKPNKWHEILFKAILSSILCKQNLIKPEPEKDN